MSAKEQPTDPKPTAVVAVNPDAQKGAQKRIGGSQSDDWNNTLANQTVQTLWLKNCDKDAQDHQFNAALAALIGIGPKDEIEGMIAAQLLAAHNAAMECYRRAMIGEQSFEGRRENLSQANKLSRTRTYAVLLAAPGGPLRTPGSCTTCASAGPDRALAATKLPTPTAKNRARIVRICDIPLSSFSEIG
jgi:hypothetical protein